MDLVENDELVDLSVQEEHRVRELVPVRRGFEIQIDGGPSLGDVVGEGGLADLARTNESDRGLACQGSFNYLANGASYHPCKLKVLL